jgi:hypothetical protein
MAVKVGIFVIGVALLIIGLVVHAHYGPINNLCRSPLGQAARGYSQAGGSISDMPNCGEASAGMDAGWVLILFGAIAAVGGLIQFIQLAAASSVKRSLP